MIGLNVFMMTKCKLTKIRKNLHHWMTAALLFLMPPVFAMAPGDIQYTREGGDPEKLESFPPSIFQHWVHRIRYRCDACHDSLFKMAPNSTPVTHDLMKQGKVCSACHNGTTAFDEGFDNCHRCHIAGEK